MGRRAHRPDAFHRRQVEAMAGYGVPEHAIARVARHMILPWASCESRHADRAERDSCHRVGVLDVRELSDEELERMIHRASACD